VSRRLQISRGGESRGAKVHLDGEDIGRDLTALTLRLVAGKATTAVLDVFIDDLSTDLEDVQAVVPEATRKLLVQLGWTPPEGDGAS
jgi:hypothetical protein